MKSIISVNSDYLKFRDIVQNDLFRVILYFHSYLFKNKFKPIFSYFNISYIKILSIVIRTQNKIYTGTDSKTK